MPYFTIRFTRPPEKNPGTYSASKFRPWVKNRYGTQEEAIAMAVQVAAEEHKAISVFRVELVGEAKMPAPTFHRAR